MKLPSWTRCWSRYWTQCWPGPTGSCFCRINEGEEFQGRTVRLCRHVPNKHNQAQLRDCNLAFSLCPQCQGPPACGPKTPGVCPRRPGHARWGRDPRRWPDPPAHRFDYPFPDPGKLRSLTMSLGENDSSVLTLQILPCKQQSLPRVLRKEWSIRRHLAHHRNPPTTREMLSWRGQAWLQCAVSHWALRMLHAFFFFFFTRLNVCGHSVPSESLPHFPNSVVFKLMLF